MGPRCQWPSHEPCAGLSRGLPGRQEVGPFYHFSPSRCLATLNWGTPGDGGSVAKQRAGAGSLRPLWAGHANCRWLAPLRCERTCHPGCALVTGSQAQFLRSPPGHQSPGLGPHLDRLPCLPPASAARHPENPGAGETSPLPRDINASLLTSCVIHTYLHLLMATHSTQGRPRNQREPSIVRHEDVNLRPCHSSPNTSSGQNIPIIYLAELESDPEC